MKCLLAALLLVASAASAQDMPFSESPDLAQPQATDGKRPASPGELNENTPASTDNTRPLLSSDDYGPNDYSGQWMIAPGIGWGPASYVASLTVSYTPTTFYGYQLYSYYEQNKADDMLAKAWGGEIAPVVYLHNPTPLTPFLGAGPGFRRWMIRTNGLVYDDGASPTLSLFAGLKFAMNSHVALTGTLKQTTFMGVRPLKTDFSGDHVPKTTSGFDIGFVFSF